jgi:hypothetical protein
MNYLEELRREDKAREISSEAALSKLTKPSFGSFGGGDSGAVEIVDSEAKARPLTKAQAKARQALLARLEAEPDIKRAFVSRWEGDVLLVTLAVRGVGTCELLIPEARFNSNALADYSLLAACVKDAE